MMNTLIEVSNISAVIQLAIAPVFLLAGISGALMVMSNRLGRIVDRGRFLKDKQSNASDEELLLIRSELNRLDARAYWTNWAITLSTACALLICLVIVFLFLGAVFNINLNNLIALLFVMAMLCLSLAFILFLREIRMSTSAFEFLEDC
jgi:hypothetical protein